MKYDQYKKINQNRQQSEHNSPKDDSDSCAGYGHGPFTQTVTAPVEQDSGDGKWCQAVQPTRSDTSPSNLLYLTGGFFPWTFSEFCIAAHNFARTPLALGIILVIVGLFVWLFKLVKRQKSYPLEPFGPIWDPVGQLLFWGAVFIAIGIIFRSIG